MTAGPAAAWLARGLMSGAALFPVSALAADALTAAAAPSAPAPADNELQEIVIIAPEPRYVAPTRRDRIGRIWAPVIINGKGPFKLVLDTGSTHSAVMASVALQLGLDMNVERPIRLRGVTGSAMVARIRVDSMVAGDLNLSPKYLPILTDALGGAEGVLGTEGLGGMRVHIDFRGDQIIIARSHGQRAPAGFARVRLDLSRNRLPLLDAVMGGVRVKAVLDTGGQTSIGNLALRDALLRRRHQDVVSKDTIYGATADVQIGEGYAAPPIDIGPLQIRNSHITFGDMKIFDYWGMNQEPALLIGMDTLGQLDTLIIDYQLSELQLRLPEIPSLMLR